MNKDLKSKEESRKYLAIFEIKIDGKVVGRLLFDNNNSPRKTLGLILKMGKGEKFAQFVILEIMRQYIWENEFMGNFVHKGCKVNYREESYLKNV